MARDKGEHMNSESAVYTAVVVCLYWLAPIRKTKTPVNYMIYRHAAKHNDVYSFRKQTLRIWEKMSNKGKENRWLVWLLPLLYV